MSIPSQAAYEARERSEFQSQIRALDKLPLSERKANLRELEEMFNPRVASLRNGIETIAERVGWLLDGNYGYGSYLIANEIAKNTRMNSVAALTQMAIAVEWSVPPRASAAWWKKLPPPTQVLLNSVVKKSILAHLRSSGRDRGRSPRRAKRTSSRRAGRDSSPTCEVGTKVQTLILNSMYFDERDAIAWVRRNKHRVTKVDRTSRSFRFRQEEPSAFLPGSFRTIHVRPGVEAVIGCPR